MPENAPTALRNAAVDELIVSGLAKDIIAMIDRLVRADPLLADAWLTGLGMTLRDARDRLQHRSA